MTYRTRNSKCLALTGTVLGVLGFLSARPALAQLPQPGDIQRLKVITISMRVGSTEKDIKQVTYSPPPGWYVRSHVVDCTAKYGNSSFTVTTVPPNWDWLTEERNRDSYQAKLDVAARAQNVGGQLKLNQQQEALLRASRGVRANHHALVVEATARGEGFLRGGGGLELIVTAELVYIGPGVGLGDNRSPYRARLSWQDLDEAPGVGHKD
jgi:hypothetical protein